MCSNIKWLLLLLSVCSVFNIRLCETLPAEQNGKARDLATAETSAKLLNLGGLFGQGSSYPNYGNGYYKPGYPNYGYGNTYYRPNNYYPQSSGGYYPQTSGGYYPQSSGGYYPQSSGGYYPQSSGGYYPQSSGGYYPGSGSYYPTTNILGTGGYGGYGGNGGLRSYSGYWQPEYSGQRNRGYGYQEQTDRQGLPSRERDSYGWSGSGGGSTDGYGRDRAYGYRGYD